MLAKKQLPFARPHLLDREFHFQSGGTGHLIFGGAHLAYNFCCGRFVYGKVSQAQPLTLPNKRTCQKNCSHNEQRLVYVVTCGRWRGYGGGGRVGRRLSQTLRFHCCLLEAGRFNSTLVSEQAFSKGAVMSFRDYLVLVNLRAPSTNVVFPFLC